MIQPRSKTDLFRKISIAIEREQRKKISRRMFTGGSEVFEEHAAVFVGKDGKVFCASVRTKGRDVPAAQLEAKMFKDAESTIGGKYFGEGFGKTVGARRKKISGARKNMGRLHGRKIFLASLFGGRSQLFQRESVKKI
jgi:hypothetical protein